MLTLKGTGIKPQNPLSTPNYLLIFFPPSYHSSTLIKALYQAIHPSKTHLKQGIVSGIIGMVQYQCLEWIQDYLQGTFQHIMSEYWVGKQGRRNGSIRTLGYDLSSVQHDCFKYPIQSRRGVVIHSGTNRLIAPVKQMEIYYKKIFNTQPLKWA